MRVGHFLSDLLVDSLGCPLEFCVECCQPFGFRGAGDVVRSPLFLETSALLLEMLFVVRKHLITGYADLAAESH